MEIIKYVTQFENMKDNKILGNPKLINSELNFKGKNNILFCENDVKLENVIINFNGDNSVIYLASSLNSVKCVIYSNSNWFLGKNVIMGENISLNILEYQNIFIGDSCYFGNNVDMSTSDYYPIFDGESKKRINFSKSIVVGDHVMVGNNVLINRGVKIGSGAIVDNNSYLSMTVKIPSNVLVSGNPPKIINKNVFFVDKFLGSFDFSDLGNFNQYKSDVFIFQVVNNETLSLDKIDEILIKLDVDSRLEFIQKLFIKNKSKNRFSI